MRTDSTSIEEILLFPRIDNKVAKLFNIELSDLTSDYNKQLNSDLMDIFSDTIFEEHDLKKYRYQRLFDELSYCRRCREVALQKVSAK